MPDATWRSRIVGYGTANPRELVANPRNWRTHPDHQRAALSGILDEVGWVAEVLVNQRTGFVVDGHLRIAAAVARHETSVPVRYVDLDDDEERLVLATLDPIAALATSANDRLAELLAGLQPTDAALQALLRDLTPPVVKTLNPDDADLTPPTEPVTKPGDLWLLGDHRLLCGDATKADDVVQLMNGEQAQFSFTDPPYNVGLAIGESTNDSRSFDDFCSWCRTWLAFMPARHCMTVGIKRLCWWDTIAGDPTWIIAWVRRNGQGNTMLGGTSKWDAILVYNCPADGDIDLIEINNDYDEHIKADGTHPTAKPVSLWDAVIRRFSDAGSLLYEPFSGTGTALLASEQTGRRCYAMEIEPAYCDVIVRRWERVTGRQAVRES